MVPAWDADRGWAAAAMVGPSGPTVSVVEVTAGAPYRAGWLALREGPGLGTAVASLPRRPDVLLVDATGRDHPRRAGLALHLGAILDLPTVGVTHRPLLADGSWPELTRGARSPLRLDDELVGYWVCTRTGMRPLAAHAGWRTDPDIAVDTVLAAAGRFRTPGPLRWARQAAREARTSAAGG